MKNIYFVKTLAYDMIVSDDGEIRRVLVDNDNCKLYEHESEAESYLQTVIEDDSSWEEYKETIKELIDEQSTILAEIEKDI